MESSSRFSIFVIILSLSSILGFAEGFFICYVFTLNAYYLSATLGFSLLLIGSLFWFYFYFMKVEPYSSNTSAPLTQMPVTRDFVNPTYRRVPIDILEAQEGREHLVDIVENNKTIHIIAELPIVGMSYVNFNCLGRMLILSFDVGNNRYYKDIELPSMVNSNSGKVKLNNWIVELDLTKIKMENLEEDQLKQEF